MLKTTLAVVLLMALTAPASAWGSSIHHDLTVTIDPENHYLEATDRITIPAGRLVSPAQFLLAAALAVVSETPGVSVELMDSEIKAEDFGMDREDFDLHSGISLNKYSITIGDPAMSEVIVTLRFSGRIHHSIKQTAEEYARGFSQTPGTISPEGVYLAGSTYWVPWFNDSSITFDLTVILPESWDAVSQGKRTIHEAGDGLQRTRWNSPDPMEEIFLIAAEFNEYGYKAGAVDVMAFLRTPDENLAKKYLDTTAQYLEMYQKLIGPYPYSKFALVENFWETGYGMPSFTLLGEKIIRFPFILHSSYPHELLHNWWGNSVYVDFKTGNWCEGLTTYMADHLIKEQRGRGVEYRCGALRGYADYVTSQNDFPLREFRSRHDAASSAVGYSKCMMVWEMLREDIGDELFTKGIQTFYEENKFRNASFDDIRLVFESVSGKDLRKFFKQWIERAGAPELGLDTFLVERDQHGFRLQFTLIQLQEGDAYTLTIPVAVSFEDKVEIKKVEMTEKAQSFEMAFQEAPLYIRVDPQFNVFRRLHHNESPPALSKAFGSEEILILIPSKATETKLDNYKQLAETWAKDASGKIDIMFDNEISELPEDKAVWLFGWSNIHRNSIAEGIKDYDSEITSGSVRFAKTAVERNGNSLVVSIRHPKNPNSIVVWLTVDNKEAVPGLARKLPHYGKYSYLAFEGDEPTNIAKGQWPTVHSPLAASLPMVDGVKTDRIAMDLQDREPLAELAPIFSAERMLAHIRFLASGEMEGRGLGSSGIDKAAAFIAERFAEAGLLPGGDGGSYFQSWEDVIDGKDKKGEVKNVIGILKGSKEEIAEESVIVCAHYDHLGLGWPDVYKGNEGKIHFGADDNASGVAVMLELAKILGSNLKPDRSIVFIAFTAEENGLRGSRFYVKNMRRYPTGRIMGVLNLDTVGRLGENKILVINSSTADEWKHIFMGIGYVTGIEAVMVTQDLDASDQVAFIEAGVPAVQIFSGAHEDYHRPTDTVEKIDASGLVKIAAFVREAILYLSEREEVLTFTGSIKEKSKSTAKQGGRRVTTGSMPDFAYSGEGVRLAGVPAGSAADEAGLQQGDIIVKLGDFTVTDLRDYSSALKSYNPGDIVTITFVRGDKRISAEIKLMAR